MHTIWSALDASHNEIDVRHGVMIQYANQFLNLGMQSIMS